MIRSILALFLVAWLSLAEGPVAPSASTPLLITSVVIDGTKAPVALKTRVGQPYNTSTIQSDVRSLWATGRFDDIRVESKQQAEGTAVVFQVVETPEYQLRQVRFVPSSYGLQMMIPEGTIINRLRAHQLANQAQDQLRSDGFQLATVDPDLVPVVGKKVDLKLTIDAGPRVRVKQVDFVGDTELSPKELRGALQALKIKRVLPGFPGLWPTWRMYPGYSADGVQQDLTLIRSLYVSQGYFDANVRLEDVQVANKSAHVFIRAEAGPRYKVRQWEVSGPQIATKIGHPKDEVMSSQQLCSTLFNERHEAEREGILEFTANMQVQPVAGSSEKAPVADLNATVDRGQPYHVNRIEFIGNRHFSEAAVRGNFEIDEGELLNEHLLRKSIMRLNDAGMFEPVNERSTIIRTNPETGMADILIRVKERKRGAWRISGPVGPANLAGPLVASINSRLPAWGSGLLELSTYTVSLSFFAFARPLLPLLGINQKIPWLPILALQRSYSPAAGWQSGFSIIPQLGWQFSAMSYGVTQVQHRLLPVLQGDRGLEGDLPVIVQTPTQQTAMYCEPPAPRFSYLRNMASMVLRLAGAVTGL